MSTGDGPGRDDAGERGRRGERIAIGGGDDSVTRIQLAARWAEAYGDSSDSLGSILKRFRAAYDYLDAVIHGVEPTELDREVTSTRVVAAPSGVSAPSYPPPAEGTPSPPPPMAPPEPRPWT